jgi:2-polyprenyl-3-methyl-5-hydroxy-6-metoxy-1,4-benzoquinol methylase
MENTSKDVPWLDKGVKRFKEVGTIIPANQRHIYEKIRDHWVGGRTVLDIGCSLGVGSNILSHEARFVWGVDVNKEAVDFAKCAFARPNLEFEVADIQNPPTRELSKFEVIVMIEVLEHLEDPDQGVAFIKRFFSEKMNSIAFITVPNGKNMTVAERDTANDLHLTHWDGGTFYEYLIKHFRSVTMYAGERLIDFGSADMIDGNSDCELVLAKVEGSI